jgi:peptidoglycan/xylan/chitin deacetylase (PgdA/CDA1 family)
MRHAAGRVVVAVALLAAFVYLIQAGDSALRAPVGITPTETTQADVEPTTVGPRQYVTSHYLVVPFGIKAIRVPILMYHYIRKPPSIRVDPLGYRLSVAPVVFEAQMDWLARSGYHAVNFNQIRGYFAGIEELPSRPVVITLDDGYRDLYTTAFPILRAHGFTAVAYIVSGFVNHPAYVTSDELVEMDRAGIEIGSHTVDHPDLARMSLGSVMFEVVQSKRWLDQLLGHPVLDFAYPSGKYNPQTIKAVEGAGYDTAVTTAADPVLHTLQGRFAWSRVRVGGGEPMTQFIVNLGPSMPTVVASRTSLVAPPAYLQSRT